VDKKVAYLEAELKKEKTINYLISEIIKYATKLEPLDISMEKLADMLMEILELSSISINFLDLTNKKSYCRLIQDGKSVLSCLRLPDKMRTKNLEKGTLNGQATLYITLKDHLSNKPIGYIFATSKNIDFFDSSIISFFEILAVQVPTIVANSLLFEKMQEESTRDLLTNSYNRKQLNIILSKITQEQTPLSLAFFDLDNFKFVNDTFGHSYGDRILLDVSDIALSFCKKHEGELFRYGGDEFVLIFYNCGLDRAMHILEELRLEIMNELSSNSELDIKQTISIGLANYPETVANPGELLEAADSALISGKLK
jgi:diguanylate cyclase (GGDEF)-like protein